MVDSRDNLLQREVMMELQVRELENGIRLMTLNGQLDIDGTNQIETQLAELCAGENQRILLDLSGVSFLASIGIRLLTLTAKSIVSRNGKIVLLHPTPDVQHVLDVTGIPTMIPVYDSFESAETILLAS